MRNRLLFSILLLGLASGPAAAYDGQPLSGLPCQVFAADSIEVSSPVAGVLEEVLVDRGSRVTKGQVIARLHSELEEAQVALAEAKANATALLNSKKAKLAFAESTLSRNLKLIDQHVISDHEIEQFRTDRDVAAFDLQSTQEGMNIAKRELDQARAGLALRTIRSPIDGVVTDRKRAAGEQTRDQPVAVIARIDPLHVELALPTSYLGRVAVNSVAQLELDVPGLAPLSAKVALVDPVVDAASNTFGVRFLVPNKDGRIPAGVKCRATFADAR